MDSITIDGTTQLVGVIGWPIAHSLSPTMHNAAFRELHLNWSYVPMPVRPGEVNTAVRGLTALGFRGFNITVPHKQTVLNLLEEISPEAQVLGAVNTVVIHRSEEGTPHLSGHNTDSAGFVGALHQGGVHPGPGQRVLVAGAGGAARAIVYALGKAGVDAIVVLNRTPERAVALVSSLSAHMPHATFLEAGLMTVETLLDAAERSTLLVNTTTLGMWPAVEGSIWPDNVPFPAHLTVCDLVYNPLDTRLLRQAARAGARTIDGLGMLALQGALALGQWVPEPLDVPAIAALMRRSAAQRLKQS